MRWASAYSSNPVFELAVREVSDLVARELDEGSAADGRDLLDALDLITSWEAWNVLRRHQGCSVARARRITERLALTALRT